MNRLMFEGRFLIGITASMIRQDDLRIIRSRLDWEKMYRLADYHRIVNIIYLGILGFGDDIPEKWKNRFFEKYQEALLLGGVFEDGEREILNLFNMREISCILLSSNRIRELYQLPELAGNHALRILISQDNFSLAKGYLIDLGYETEEFYKGEGERFKTTSGLTVELYHTLPFHTPLYRRTMAKLMEEAQTLSGFNFIRILPRNTQFSFLMAQAAYRYVTDALTIQEVLDLMMYHRSIKETLDEEAMTAKLKEFHVEGLSGKLLTIAYMWFGDKGENVTKKQVEDTADYDILEDRLLTRGIINKETDEQALSLAFAIEKERNRELRKERWKRFKKKMTERRRLIGKKVRWCFPNYRYMCVLYPTLEKAAVLLPFFWMVRALRFTFRQTGRN